MTTREGTDERGEGTLNLVASRDGTEIAYFTSGDGPPLVLVHGAPADHTRWRPLLPYLEPHVTVHAIDRRGRGASGDAADYTLAREFEDAAAVVDAVAAASGSPVGLYGHSFGGLCAFGAATLTANVHKLILYEGWPLIETGRFTIPEGVAERLDALLARGDRDRFLRLFFGEVALIPDDEIDALRAMPSWQARLGAAPALRRELRATAEAAFDAEEAAKIKAPVLLLTGSESSDPSAGDVEAVAAALPDARIVVLEGHQHVADVLAPALVAEHILRFLRGGA